jgi:hypothetical protein
MTREVKSYKRGISILLYQPKDNVVLTAAACNAPARFLNAALGPLPECHETEPALETAG